MRNHAFDLLWREAVEKPARELIALYPEGEKLYGWRLKSTESDKRKFRAFYNECNKEVHKNFFYGKDDFKKHIDIHKIGACFAKAVVDCSLMDFSDVYSAPAMIRFSNYILAFVASVGVIDFFMGISYKNKKPEFYESYKQKENMFYPKTTKGHDSYCYGRIKAMILNDVYGRPFDMVGYADMLFWLEHYNRQIIEGKIDVQI